MLVLLRGIQKLNLNNDTHMEIVRALNAAGIISYQDTDSGLVFSVIAMPVDTPNFKFELMCEQHLPHPPGCGFIFIYNITIDTLPM